MSPTVQLIPAINNSYAVFCHKFVALLSQIRNLFVTNLLKHKYMKINLIGEFDSQCVAFKEFIVQFDEALADNKVRKIKIELCSVGGCTYSAFAIYNRIKSSPKPVQITANGFVASCAVLIFAAGHERLSYSNTTFMVHEFSSTSGYDEVSSVAFKDIKIQLAEQKNYATLLANNSLLDSAKWYKLMKRTTYFDAEQALKIGLVQGIV